LAWPVLFAGMGASGFRGARDYAVLAGAALLTLLPYLAFAAPHVLSHFGHGGGPAARPGPLALVNALGWPLTNGIGASTGPLPMALYAGWIGLALFGIGLFLLW